uniref:Uncharacterized protein n=1 Tax=Caenorhabditis japonica TaxID=281687 RepID=A0A8R1I641_CAEJA
MIICPKSVHFSSPVINLESHSVVLLYGKRDAATYDARPTDHVVHKSARSRRIRDRGEHERPRFASVLVCSQDTYSIEGDPPSPVPINRLH